MLTFEAHPRHPPVEELVRHVVAAHLECATSEVRPSDELEADLAITRLGLMLIGLDLEDVLNVSLPFEAMERVRTVADLARVAAEARRVARPGHLFVGSPPPGRHSVA